MAERKKEKEVKLPWTFLVRYIKWIMNVYNIYNIYSYSPTTNDFIFQPIITNFELLISHS